ncbi:MAG: hypothetical protein ACRDS1_16465 [Pseudonocardiaceae bacterium]
MVHAIIAQFTTMTKLQQQLEVVFLVSARRRTARAAWIPRP